MLKLTQEKGQPIQVYSDRKAKIAVWKASTEKNNELKKKWSFIPQKYLFETKFDQLF